MKNLLKYNGAKSGTTAKLAILNLIPDDIRRYTEVFVGGGSIFFEQPTTLPRWINDSNPHLVAFYQDLRDRGEWFLDQIRSLLAATVEQRRALHKRFLADDTLPPGLRYFVLNRLSRNGKVDLTPKWKHRTWFQEQLTLKIAEGDRLAEASNALQNTRITCWDFERVLLDLGPNDFAFLDPPYICETELSPSAALYEKRFAMHDHARLFRRLLSTRCRWLLTYDDNEINRERFKSFHITPVCWTYMGNDRRIEGREIIVTNYAPAGSLKPFISVPRAA